MTDHDVLIALCRIVSELMDDIDAEIPMVHTAVIRAAVTEDNDRLRASREDNSRSDSDKPKNVMCPECGGEMTSRTGKYGVFWGCKAYPKCKGTRDSEGRSKAERDSERVGSQNDPQDFRDRQDTGYSFNRK